MEFFDWLNFPQFILRYIPWEIRTADSYAAASRLNLILCLAAAGGLYLLGLLFGGFGLRKIAKRAGVKGSWMGFFPVLNTYFTGKLAGEARFFGQKMKRVGLYAALSEVVYIAIETTIVVLSFLLMRGSFYVFEESPYYEGYGTWTLDPTALGADRWMYDTTYYCTIVSYLVSLIVIMFFCVMFVAFFRKYYARGPILMTLLCALLPFRGFAIFAVRNNAAVDYDAFLRRRAEEYARRNAPNGYGGNYGGNYSGNDGGPRQEGGERPSEGGADPFPDFGGDQSGSGKTPPDNPFSDF